MHDHTGAGVAFRAGNCTIGWSRKYLNLDLRIRSCFRTFYISAGLHIKRVNMPAHLEILIQTLYSMWWSIQLCPNGAFFNTPMLKKTKQTWLTRSYKWEQIFLLSASHGSPFCLASWTRTLPPQCCTAVPVCALASVGNMAALRSLPGATWRPPIMLPVPSTWRVTHWCRRLFRWRGRALKPTVIENRLKCLILMTCVALQSVNVDVWIHKIHINVDTSHRMCDQLTLAYCFMPQLWHGWDKSPNFTLWHEVNIVSFDMIKLVVIISYSGPY